MKTSPPYEYRITLYVVKERDGSLELTYIFGRDGKGVMEILSSLTTSNKEQFVNHVNTLSEIFDADVSGEYDIIKKYINQTKK